VKKEKIKAFLCLNIYYENKSDKEKEKERCRHEMIGYASTSIIFPKSSIHNRGDYRTHSFSLSVEEI